MLLWGLTAFSAIALWFVLHALVLSGFQEHGSQARLYARFRAQLAAETAPIGGIIKPGSPVAILSMPSIGVRNLVVIEGTTAAQLTHGPGHLSDTPLPGQFGTSDLFGRSVTYGAPFRGINSLRPGALLQVTTGEGEFTYRVDRIRHRGSPLPPPEPANGSRLILVTADAGGWRSGWAPSRAVYVDSTLLHGQAQPAGGGRPTAVGTSSLAMRGDTGTLVPLAFWMEALLLVSLTMAWSWARWGRRQTWMLGLPVLLAVIWGATGAAELLLPNLY